MNCSWKFAINITYQTNIRIKINIESLLVDNTLKSQFIQFVVQNNIFPKNFHNIIYSVQSYGSDPRDVNKYLLNIFHEPPPPITVEPGAIVRGIVRNITSFGSYFEIGVKQVGFHFLSNKFRYKEDKVFINAIFDVSLINHKT